ncbi:MAG: class II aldolase/adducin family protein [Alphaproteobacteria bacterium]|nr:class II aldolase/adducin family protein [Alphaproteobacteria bacterium]
MSNGAKTKLSVVADTERRVRIDLAACYRLVAHYGWDQLIYSHLSAVIPGAERRVFLNSYGMTFDEITASSLVEVSLDGRIVSDAMGSGINPAAPTLHLPFYTERADIGCVIHLETDAGTGVSCQRDGLLPISQTALALLPHVAYHDFEGFALDRDESARLLADAAGKRIVFLRNHGTLVLGSTVASAFQLTFLVEQACRAQLAAQSGGAPLLYPPGAVVARTGAQEEEGVKESERAWEALLRMLDRRDPTFRE